MSDRAKVAIVVANYTFGSSFTNRLLYIEGEEVFGSIKGPADCPPSTDENSHRLDYEFFSSMGICSDC